FTLPKGGRTLHVQVRKSWGAGAYALVDVFRPASATEAPERAISLTWLGLQPGRRQDVAARGRNATARTDQSEALISLVKATAVRLISY
ncbi:MAG TPA: hypothetical protein PLD10_20495, partial [Rhodopila sp.]|nr:hypothetical protein [Rhodopila sp.]